jgi:hypothetical protein
MQAVLLLGRTRENRLRLLGRSGRKGSLQRNGVDSVVRM